MHDDRPFGPPAPRSGPSRSASWPLAMIALLSCAASHLEAAEPGAVTVVDNRLVAGDGTPLRGVEIWYPVGWNVTNVAWLCDQLRGRGMNALFMNCPDGSVPRSADVATCRNAGIYAVIASFHCNQAAKVAFWNQVAPAYRDFPNVVYVIDSRYVFNADDDGNAPNAAQIAALYTQIRGHAPTTHISSDRFDPTGKPGTSFMPSSIPNALDAIAAGKPSWVRNASRSNDFTFLADHEKAGLSWNTGIAGNPAAWPANAVYYCHFDRRFETDVRAKGGSWSRPSAQILCDRAALRIPAAGTAQFRVRLSSPPAAAVNVSVTGIPGLAGRTDWTTVFRPSPATLTFTAGDWSAPRTVTLTDMGGESRDAETGTLDTNAIRLTPTSTGTGLADVFVTVQRGSGTAPSIAGLADAGTGTGQALSVPFTIADDEAPSGLTLDAWAYDQALLPPNGLTIAGSGVARTLTMSPSAGRTGRTLVRVRARDGGGQIATGFFMLTVGGPVTPQPEIAVSRAALAIADGGSDPVSGTMAEVPTTVSYTIANTGTAALTLTGSPAVNLSAANNCSASVTSQPAASIAAGGSSTLAITVTPLAAGPWSLMVSTASNDADEHPYDWTVSGTAIANNGLPTVTIAATQPQAVERPALSGTFTITRSGTTTSPLAVSLAIAGTASPTVDYQPLPTTVTIPSGQASATVAVAPIDEPSVEPEETVVASLVADAATYNLGAARSAQVTVSDTDLVLDIGSVTLSGSSAAPTATSASVRVDTGPATVIPISAGTWSYELTTPNAIRQAVNLQVTGHAPTVLQVDESATPVIGDAPIGPG